MSNPYNWGLCACCTEPTVKFLVQRLKEEMVELMTDHNIDELCDVMCILSQLVFKLTRVPIVLPFADKSFQKGRDRYNQHGCVRSYRNRCTS